MINQYLCKYFANFCVNKKKYLCTFYNHYINIKYEIKKKQQNTLRDNFTILLKLIFQVTMIGTTILSFSTKNFYLEIR